MDPFYGEIRLFPFNYIPIGWAACDGSLLNVQYNPALFAILGTQYGGDGRTTFGLPNLNGRVAMHQGTGAGLTARAIGQTSGADTVALSAANLASHTHQIVVKDGVAATNLVDTPDNNAYLTQPRSVQLYNSTVSSEGYTLAPSTIGVAGNPGVNTGTRSTMQPYLTLIYAICVDGIWPEKP